MSKLPETWNMSRSIADDIAREGYLDWAAHLNGVMDIAEELEEQNKALQAKLSKLGTHVLADEHEEAKRIAVMSNDDVVRELQAEAVLNAMHYADEYASTKDSWIGGIQKYYRKLRNPEQEKV